MHDNLDVKIGRRPVLDPEFVPAVLWNRSYLELVRKSGKAQKLKIAVERNDGTISVHATEILPHAGGNVALNRRYVERLIKFLLWMKGGWKITLCGGDPALAAEMSCIYRPGGEREFDYNTIGVKIYGRGLEISHVPYEKAPAEKEINLKLGGNWDGCRIGFDLGGSDRKCAAVIDGEVVFAEEVRWDPYFQKDPKWHKEGINDSLKRAAAKMPRVDAIGGSAAGVYVDNQVRAASLFRGVSEADFKSHVQRMFLDIQKEWNNVPFAVVNDGEVTALAGSMSMKASALLGISMGTSLAAGYVTSKGAITNWLNELAFAPIDYRPDAPADEWSGDKGCGVQYFSQQGAARLAKAAGIEFPESMPLAERLVEVQTLMAAGDPKAENIYRTIGACFGYAVAHYADFYELENLLILGRVTTGTGGEIILAEAADLLKSEFPELHKKIKLSTPDEKAKRLGQAVAAASLPKIK